MKIIRFRAARFASICALSTIATLSAGCSSDLGGGLFTGSLLEPAPAPVAATFAPKVDPACIALNSQIEAWKKDGISARIEQAAAKKHKLSTADIAKADQLNKANADFQAKCGPALPTEAAAPDTSGVTTAAAPIGGVLAAPAAAAAATAKAKIKDKAAAAVATGVSAVTKQ